MLDASATGKGSSTRTATRSVKIKSLRDNEDTLKEGISAREIAISIDGPTVGRQIDVDTVLYVDILESEVKSLADYDLNMDEKMVLEETLGSSGRRTASGACEFYKEGGVSVPVSHFNRLPQFGQTMKSCSTGFPQTGQLPSGVAGLTIGGTGAGAIGCG